MKALNSKILAVFLVLFAVHAGVLHAAKDFQQDHSASGGRLLWKGVFEGIQKIRERGTYLHAAESWWQTQQEQSMRSFIQGCSALNDKNDEDGRNSRDYALAGVDRAMGLILVQKEKGAPDEHLEYSGLVSAWDPVLSPVVNALMVEDGGPLSISIKELSAIVWAEATRIDLAEPNAKKRQLARESVVNAMIDAQRRYNIDLGKQGKDQPACVEGTFTTIGAALSGISPDFRIMNVSVQEVLVDRYQALVADFFSRQPLELQKHLLEEDTSYDDPRYLTYENECRDFVLQTMRREFSAAELQEGQFETYVVDAMEPGYSGTIPAESITKMIIAKQEPGEEKEEEEESVPHGQRFERNGKEGQAPLQQPNQAQKGSCQASPASSSKDIRDYLLLSFLTLGLVHLVSRRKVAL